MSPLDTAIGSLIAVKKTLRRLRWRHNRLHQTQQTDKDGTEGTVRRVAMEIMAFVCEDPPPGEHIEVTGFSSEPRLVATAMEHQQSRAEVSKYERVMIKKETQLSWFSEDPDYLS